MRRGVEIHLVPDAAARARALATNPHACVFAVDEPLRMHVRRKYALTDAELEEPNDYLRFLFQKETTQPHEWWVEYVAWVRRLALTRPVVFVSVVEPDVAPGLVTWLAQEAPDLWVNTSALDLTPPGLAENP
jgi:hypothetical protein